VGLTFEALFHPKPDFPYLDEAGGRFEREAGDGFRPVNAWWLAELSLLSYVDSEELVGAVLARAGLRDVHFVESGSTHCVVADALVVFRGTDDLRDLLSDLAAHLTRAGDGRVHRGFQLALDAVWDDARGGLRVDLEPR